MPRQIPRRSANSFSSYFSRADTQPFCSLFFFSADTHAFCIQGKVPTRPAIYTRNFTLFFHSLQSRYPAVLLSAKIPLVPHYQNFILFSISFDHLFASFKYSRPLNNPIRNYYQFSSTNHLFSFTSLFSFWLSPYRAAPCSIPPYFTIVRSKTTENLNASYRWQNRQQNARSSYQFFPGAILIHAPFHSHTCPFKPFPFNQHRFSIRSSQTFFRVHSMIHTHTYVCSRWTKSFILIVVLLPSSKTLLPLFFQMTFGRFAWS